eukprot:2019880-Pyramimonas_sp.AAC.1
MLGSSEFWRKCSHRAHSDALVGECAVYIARHCAEYPRSSGGWVYVGDLSIKADDTLLLDETKLMEHWQSFLNPNASHDTV